VSWGPAESFLTIALANFRGSNYEYFFTYFADFYWGACLLITLPYLYRFDADTPLSRDKYVCFLRTLLSVGNLFRGKKPIWDRNSRLGMLTLGVKLFFIPYLTSWVIKNTFNQRDLLATFTWDLYTVNAFLVALFIYVDTMVYSFGYVVEAPFLKNKIKSVEPTLLGWAVCLWCYPPFNEFSFKIFDYQVFDIARTYPTWVDGALTCVISLLWGIFAWASVALGFKASNLTNRGIVDYGPYRFVRHPAYTAKLLIWIIQGVFFTKFSVGMLLGFVLIYGLRAWTEERHLSADPDFVAYKRKVRWLFVPKLI
jgi:protein-S-isoprenylcysteine O-methyltransferase Ste14